MGHMKKLLKKIMKLPVLLLYRCFILFNRVDKNIILFESNLGRNYSGNPRFIYEKLVSLGLDRRFQCYFILEDTKVSIPGNGKKLQRKSIAYFFLFSKAGFWVSDTRMPLYLIKRKATVYIQTWHGTPLKKLALDLTQVSMEGEADLEQYKRLFVENSKTWDYLVSQNSYSTDIFRRAFAFDKEILEIGYPRNDLLINDNYQDNINKLKQKLNLPLDKKIILYAPTWRDNEYFGPQQYKFSSGMDFAYLKEQLSKEYIILVKAHYLVGEHMNNLGLQGFLYPFGAGFDIAELYLISDYLITDYSSVMFDYSILNRPMIFFTYDLDYYKDELRGFYFDFIEEAPGPFARTTKQLVEALLEYNFDTYRTKYQAFRVKYNHADKGEASQKVVDLICSLGGK